MYHVTVPEEILLVTLENTGGVGFISLDAGTSGAITLVAKSTHPKAVAFDRKQKVYNISVRAYMRACVCLCMYMCLSVCVPVVCKLYTTGKHSQSTYYIFWRLDIGGVNRLQNYKLL